ERHRFARRIRRSCGASVRAATVAALRRVCVEVSMMLSLRVCAISAPLALLLLATPRPGHGQINAGPWPMFHHGLDHTGLSAVDTSSNTGALKWRFVTGCYDVFS